jgi:predicted SprT family Zn-dependent metalloprotease
MDKREAVELARSLMSQHGLGDWKLRVTKARWIYGSAIQEWKQLELSGPMIVVNDVDAITDVVLHEVAHGLVGQKAFHGPLWKAKALEIGARPLASYIGSGVVVIPYRWKGIAPCGHEFLAMQRTRRSCGECAGDLIEWTRHEGERQ